MRYMRQEGAEVAAMNSVEEEGRTVEEAKGKALARLGSAEEDVEIEVIEEGSRGVFGIGGRNARVRITVAPRPHKMREIVERLLKLMDIRGTVRAEVDEEAMHLDIETEGMDGLLIGKSGATLEALQHIVSRMAYRQNVGQRVVVDVGGYRARRTGLLRRKTLALAERVKATGKEAMMEPLQPAERRIVHITLNDDPGVRTYTVGEGAFRSVVVAPETGDEHETEESERGSVPEPGGGREGSRGASSDARREGSELGAW
jgi:spoIIIJ-associated protein